MSDNWVVQNLENALNTWNEKLAEIWQLIIQSPENFKGGTIWNAIVDIHGAVQAIGLALLVLFFVVGVMRTCGNFAELKDLIRNLSKKKSADAQILMRNYMMERFLERISLSEYKDKFILKGGMLVAAMVGLDARATMDLDATIKGANVSLTDVETIISNIIAIPIDDGVLFCIKRISEIMEEADYPGVRVSMETKFDGVITPLKIDISTGDVITPKEIRYRFNLMLEDRTIEVWAYNLETVLAEKLETVISRNVTNTRMRDFYDIYILQKLYGEQLKKKYYGMHLWLLLENEEH